MRALSKVISISSSVPPLPPARSSTSTYFAISSAGLQCTMHLFCTRPLIVSNLCMACTRYSIACLFCSSCIACQHDMCAEPLKSTSLCRVSTICVTVLGLTNFDGSCKVVCLTNLQTLNTHQQHNTGLHFINNLSLSSYTTQPRPSNSYEGYAKLKTTMHDQSWT